jgi:hypothetical protein
MTGPLREPGSVIGQLVKICYAGASDACAIPDNPGQHWRTGKVTQSVGCLREP